MQLIKEKTAVIGHKMMWYSFIKDGIKHSIKGVTLQDYYQKYHKDRQKLAKIIRTLRNSNYHYTELKGRIHINPLQFFREYFANGGSIETLFYNPVAGEWFDNHNWYIFEGYIQDANLISFQFTFRIYVYELYEELLDLISTHVKDYIKTDIEVNLIILERPTS